MNITVTENASKRISTLIQEAYTSNSQDRLVLRISVDGGGCAGFMYKYEFIQESTISKDDFVIKQDDAKIVVDSISQQFMANCIVDFIEELGASYFEVRNPNAVSTCGCKNSFSV